MFIKTASESTLSKNGLGVAHYRRLLRGLQQVQRLENTHGLYDTSILLRRLCAKLNAYPTYNITAQNTRWVNRSLGSQNPFSRHTAGNVIEIYNEKNTEKIKACDVTQEINPEVDPNLEARTVTFIGYDLLLLDNGCTYIRENINPEESELTSWSNNPCHTRQARNVIKTAIQKAINDNKNTDSDIINDTNVNLNNLLVIDLGFNLGDIITDHIYTLKEIIMIKSRQKRRIDFEFKQLKRSGPGFGASAWAGDSDAGRLKQRRSALLDMWNNHGNMDLQDRLDEICDKIYDIEFSKTFKHNDSTKSDCSTKTDNHKIESDNSTGTLSVSDSVCKTGKSETKTDSTNSSTLILSSKYSLCIQELDELLLLDPLNVETLYTRALLFLLEKNYTACQEDLYQILAIEERHFPSLQLLFRIHEIHQDNEGMKKISSQLTNLCPRDPAIPVTTQKSVTQNLNCHGNKMTDTGKNIPGISYNVNL